MYDNLLRIASFFLYSHGKVKILGYFHFPRISLENEYNASEKWNSLCTDALLLSERIVLGEGASVHRLSWKRNHRHSGRIPRCDFSQLKIPPTWKLSLSFPYGTLNFRFCFSNNSGGREEEEEEEEEGGIGGIL